MNDRHHICLLILDSVRAANTTCYGYHRPTTPFLEQLAARALLYQNAYAPANYSIPSHVSLLTGLYPSEHGLTFDPRKRDLQLHPTINRLPKLLDATGYATYIFSQNPLVSYHTGVADDFAHHAYYWDPHWRPKYKRTLPNRLWNLVIRKILRKPFPYQRGWSTCTEDTLADIRDVLMNATQPTFAMANLMDAHMPYTAPIHIIKQFVPGDPWEHFLRYSEIHPRKYNLLLEQVDPEDQRHKMMLYDAAIHHLDRCLQGFVDTLQRDGLLSNTLLIITADHGEMFGEHDNIVGHGPRVYQELLKIPLIIVHPDFTQGRSISRPVSLIDLFPTILAEAQAAPQTVAQKHHGINLLDLEAARAAVVGEYCGISDATFAEHRHRNPALADRTRFGRQTAFIEEDYKYIEWEGRENRLYHLKTDPGERMNLINAPEHSQARRRLEALRDRWRAALQSYPPLPRTHQGSQEEAEILSERLKALGY